MLTACAPAQGSEFACVRSRCGAQTARSQQSHRTPQGRLGPGAAFGLDNNLQIMAATRPERQGFP